MERSDLLGSAILLEVYDGAAAGKSMARVAGVANARSLHSLVSFDSPLQDTIRY